MPITNIITATVTAYCACKICCGPNAKGVTANGQKPTPSHTIAAARTIPFGSTVIIGTNTFKVEDRLAKRYDSRFDIFMATHKEAKNYGIKTNQTVTIITHETRQKTVK